MSLELLVALGCLQAQACPELSKAYYASRPAYHSWVRHSKAAVERELGRGLVVAIPVSYAALSGRPFQIKIWKNISCGYKSNVTNCIYSYSF